MQELYEQGKEPYSKSYMWLYRTYGDTDQPIVMYEYEDSRCAAHPKEFLDGFDVYFYMDSYTEYHILSKKITVVGCWAYLWRKLCETMKSLSKHKAQNSSTAHPLLYEDIVAC